MSASVHSLRAHRAALHLQRAGWPLRTAQAFTEGLEAISTGDRVALLVDHGLSLPEARRWLAEYGYVRRDHCAGCGCTLTAWDCMSVKSGRAYCRASCS